MASRQSVSSILKPQKIRAPLKEIESVDQDVDEDTATIPKKKVSFSGTNNMKMFITGASSLTVPTLLDEQISMMSDSSHGDKTKLSGKLEKSDGQITIESINCINMEKNGHVVIEYESPNDNMEMTEALSGEILSNTVYTVDNNVSVHHEHSLDYSANNMEFTEAVALGNILNVDLSNSSSVEMSETLNDENEQPNTQLQHTNSVLLHSIDAKNTSSLHSSNMEITHANIKSNIVNFYSMNESCNIELTNVSAIPLKSNCLNDDQKSCSMVEFTQLLPGIQLIENNCESFYENCQKSESTESEINGQINENSNCELEVVHNLHPKTPEINNYENYENVICGFENSNINKEIVGKMSSSMVSMDVDSPTKSKEYDISYVSRDCSKLATHDHTNSIDPIMIKTENKKEFVKDDTYSNVIEISNHKNSDFKTFVVSTSASFVQETSQKNNLNKSTVVVEEPQLKSILLTQTNIASENHTFEMDKSLEVMENHQSSFSSKTLIHSAPEDDIKNDDIMFNTSDIVEENQQKRYSRKSIRLTSNIDQNSFIDDQDYSDLPDLFEENQNECSIKSVSVSDIDQIQFQEKNNFSVSSFITEENQLRCPKKSIACLPLLNQVQSPEKMDLSNTFMYVNYPNVNEENTSVLVEKNLQKNYSRRTIGPTSMFTSNNFSDDVDSSLSNHSFVIKGIDVSNSKNVIVSSIDDCNHSNDLSVVSNNSKINHADLDLDSSNENNFVSKCGHQSLLRDVVCDDDLNSPFRKKSRKNVSSVQSTNKSVYDLYEKITETNNKENKSDNTNDVCSVDSIEYSKMDISVDAERDNCIEKNSSLDKDTTLLTSLNNISLIKQPPNILICDRANSSSLMNDLHEHNSREKNLSITSESKFSAVLNTLQEDHKKNAHDVCEKVVVCNEVEQNEIHLNKLNDGCVNLTDICVNDISNMSISDNAHQEYRKSSIESRKRSYSNVDSAPLSCSSFTYKSNDRTTENVNKENFLKESLGERPIERVSEISTKSEIFVENAIDEDIINEEPTKEYLNREATDFLRKWNDLYFVKNKLVLDTCNNKEWVFNMLDNNIKLIIKYFPILNDHSFLKVEDILLTAQITTEDEIIKFGTNWILSKYSPKIYKKICTTSSDVELLLKSLQVDIQFISLVMKNMVLVRDIYSVSFEDNTAEFFLQSRDPLLMVCIKVSMANIHKLSVKDITVNCLFGDFDLKILDEILARITKDCNVLQSLIQNLKNFISTIQVISK